MIEKKDRKYKNQYGEFIPTFFNWISIDEQKRKAEELEKMTKNK